MNSNQINFNSNARPGSALREDGDKRRASAIHAALREVSTKLGCFQKKKTYKLKGLGHDARCVILRSAFQDEMIAAGVQTDEVTERHYRGRYGKKTFTTHVVFPLAEVAEWIEKGAGDWSWVRPFNGANGGNDWLARLCTCKGVFVVGARQNAPVPTMDEVLAEFAS